ncbi:hypothetical protein L228DRAFT_250007 [Xylona heveae TC161]|uniref:Azaphilone pigments biosynthesis cluster protein L N-terminal domain-containing protein n=1 Tax=Xylona heveae (strain CBS 132557 / TC161) TaxID=1328760 RepID=A0A165AE61_XYLHT|nr:hypothetical protein L228DRAFT_250007 [Xylona heveae TC161]KZF20330.1 hypothetical protein L228DRAFT_250007 [Xylona heveae TC161]
MDAGFGAIGVVSLALQLIESIDKIQKFIKSLKKAPEHIRSISGSLEDISDVLDAIREDQLVYEGNKSIKKALLRCEKCINDIRTIIETLEPGFSSTHRISRVWTAIQTSRADEDIQKIERRLEAAKTTLGLAQNSSLKSLMIVQHQEVLKRISPTDSLKARDATTKDIIVSSHGSEQGHLQDFRNEIDRISSSWAPSVMGNQFKKRLMAVVEQTVEKCYGKDIGAESSVVEIYPNGCQSQVDDIEIRRKKQRTIKQRTYTETHTMFGRFECETVGYTQSKRRVAEHQTDTEEDSGLSTSHTTRFRFVPSAWLKFFRMSCVIELKLSKLDITGWTSTVKAWNLVSSDSEIFHLCREGDVKGIQTLFSKGLASPFDVDQNGFTPLHISAFHYKQKATRFLLQEGADWTATTNRKYSWATPFAHALDPFLPHQIADCTRSTPRVRLSILNELISFSDGLEESLTTSPLSRFVLQAYCGMVLAALKDLHPRLDTSLAWLMKSIKHIEGVGHIYISQALAECLAFALYHEGARCDALGALELCDTLTVQQFVLQWISGYDPSWVNYEETVTENVKIRPEIIRKLIRKCGDLHFTYNQVISSGPCCGNTILALALSKRIYFDRFKLLLVRSGISIENFVRDAIPSLGQGWTEQALLSVFSDEDLTEGHNKCDACVPRRFGLDLRNFHYISRLERHKNGVRIDDCFSTATEMKQRLRIDTEDFLARKNLSWLYWYHQVREIFVTIDPNTVACMCFMRKTVYAMDSGTLRAMIRDTIIYEKTGYSFLSPPGSPKLIPIVKLCHPNDDKTFFDDEESSPFLLDIDIYQPSTGSLFTLLFEIVIRCLLSFK